MLNTQKVNVIPFVGAILICLWGGIYDFTASLYGAVFSVGLYFIVKGRKDILFPLNITSCGLGFIFLGYVLSVFTAGDKGMAVIGVMRFAAILIFWIFWSNLDKETQESIWLRIPEIAALLTGIAIILFFVPQARDYLFRAGRLGGVFQYSNTYALFLLIALIILIYKEKKGKREYIETVVLICGIVFCGSRSVAAMATIIMMILLIRKKSDWLKIIWILVGTTIIGIMFQVIMKLDLQRLSKLSLDSSTLNGRFLYYQDALPVIWKNPFGLGYMGYFFLQPQFQTGNYITKFVHNDVIQYGLDAGIIALISLVVIIVANILNRKNAEEKRMVLLVLFLHCLFDFDLQYQAMTCILMMCMKTDSERVYKCRKKRIKYVFLLFTMIFLYFSCALGLSYFGLNEFSLSLYSKNTFAREALMQEKGEGTEAEIIIEENGMLPSAYEVAVKQHIERQEYDKAYEDIQGVIRCAGYNISYYNQAVYYLSICLQQAINNEDLEQAQKILEEIQRIPEILKKLEDRTSKQAYRINDKPTFELDEEIQQYIENVSGISLV